MQHIIRHETNGHSPPSLLLHFDHFAHTGNVCLEEQLHSAYGVSSFGTSDADWVGHFFDYLKDNHS